MNRPDGETSKGRNVQGAKRLGGETSRGRTDEGAKRPVTVLQTGLFQLPLTNTFKNRFYRFFETQELFTILKLKSAQVHGHQTDVCG